MARIGVVAVALSAAIVAATSIAYAASLAQTSSRLTVYTQCLAKPAVDASVFENDGTNQGAAPELLVRSQSGGSNARALVYFDLAPCGLSPSSELTAATFELYLATAPSQSRMYDAYRLTSTWDESSVVWGNQPTASPVVTATVPTGTSSSVWLSWDVTADIAAFAAGGETNYGWRVGDQAESSAVAVESRFAAREQSDPSQHPRLTVDYYP